jgi:hypothetical protein
MHHLMWGLWIIAAGCYIGIFRDISREVRGE